MSKLFTGQLFMFKVAAKIQLAFTAAVTDIITATAHGLSEGDCIWVSSSTTLPAGLSASTNYYVRDITTNTFKVSATRGGAVVDVTDTGTGTHTYNLKGKVVMTSDYKNIELSFNTANSANLTLKIQGSDQDGVDFNAAQSSTNRWDYLQIKDLEDMSSLDGDTGIALTGTDDNRNFEVNINHKKYTCAQVTTWTAGNVNLVLTGASD